MIFFLQAMRDLENVVSLHPNKSVLCICKIQKRAEVRSFPYRYLY
jgi:hypothetical protein